ncbi:glycosyltransferase [Kovacikia minuta CCNUW1]|uniref:glycosyltransferase family 2 protein n=1 Tax=Kovacikia minuta TaxID=2931930 RepID=UPI001CCE6451|nr:glycosyltransferase family 2 protein [Kovacikia minuta]UBF27717.1 glycosyltransferase [Kovacikia minuta CCNUW1]
MGQLNASPQTFVSLCMIVKNEGKHLARCLASAQPYVDEIVIIDTGSQDNTLEIAAQFGAKVDFFKWCDDFAAARNYSLSKVSGEWVLHLDADEELIVEDLDFHQQLLAQPDVLIHAVTRTDINVPEAAFLGGFHARVFRNLPGFRYVNRYHEQLQYQGDRPLVYNHLEGVKILHYGNSDEAALREKTLTRDIPILESIHQQEGLSFWLLDCLARNYLRTDQFDKAQNCYQEAFDRLLPHLIGGEKPDGFYWVPTLMHFMAAQALERNDFETARLLCQRGLEWCPTHLPLTYMAGSMLLELGFPLGAIAYFEQCLHLAQTSHFYSREPFVPTLLNLDPACGIGLAQMELKNWELATAAFERALSFDPNCEIAQQNLETIKGVKDGE